VLLLQVELNTIASSFGCVSARASALHLHLLQRFLDSRDPATSPPLAAALATLAATGAAAAAAPTAGPAGLVVKAAGFNELRVAAPGGAAGSGDLPPNPSVERLSGALAAAHALYDRRRPRPPSGGQAAAAEPDVARVVAFVVQPGERNVVDQVRQINNETSRERELTEKKRCVFFF
jgi:hypothetical protein